MPVSLDPILKIFLSIADLDRADPFGIAKSPLPAIQVAPERTESKRSSTRRTSFVKFRFSLAKPLRNIALRCVFGAKAGECAAHARAGLLF